MFRPSSAAVRQIAAVASRSSVASTQTTFSQTTTRRLLSSRNNAATRAVMGVNMETFLQSNNNNTTIRWFSSSNDSSSTEDSKNEQDDNKKQESDAAEAEEDTAAETESEDATADAQQQQIASLQQENQDLKDQLLRSLAEQENIRTIARNDVSAANQFAIKRFAKSLLETVDNLDRALEAVSEDDKTSDSFASFYQGIELTQQGLVKALESNGCVAMQLEPGDAFDPSLHSALMEYPDPTQTPGTVGQVIKKGYTLNSRVLRPAEVGVVKK